MKEYLEIDVKLLPGEDEDYLNQLKCELEVDLNQLKGDLEIHQRDELGVALHQPKGDFVVVD